MQLLGIDMHKFFDYLLIYLNFYLIIQLFLENDLENKSLQVINIAVITYIVQNRVIINYSFLYYFVLYLKYIKSS